MDEKLKEVERNRPSEEGRNNDNQLRDDSGLQPGINTISSSDSDEANTRLTRTASDDFRTEDFGEEKADKTFDEVGKDGDDL
ncbi:MAG TPA: hypothetical protein VGB56_12575 [Flavisolibacter sp.]